MRQKLAIVVALLVIGFSSASACPSCYGDVNSSETQAMKWAILSLLGVTGGVLALMSGFFLYIRKQARDFEERFNNRLN